MAEGGTGALRVRGARFDDFDIEFVVGIDIFYDAGADVEDLEHAGCCATEDDDCEDDDHQDGGFERVFVWTCQAGGESDADGTAETSPEEHCLVAPGHDVFDVGFAAPPVAVAVEEVDEGGEWEDGHVACGADAEASDDDEAGFEDEVGFSKERDAQVDEDEVFGELGENLEDEFDRKLCATRHVVVCVVFDTDAAEEKRHDA